jgi:hypothetical protein
MDGADGENDIRAFGAENHGEPTTQTIIVKSQLDINTQTDRSTMPPKKKDEGVKQYLGRYVKKY